MNPEIVKLAEHYPFTYSEIVAVNAMTNDISKTKNILEFSLKYDIPIFIIIRASNKGIDDLDELKNYLMRQKEEIWSLQ